MAEMPALVRIDETLDLTGYVLTEANLRACEMFAHEAVASDQEQQNHHLSCKVTARTTSDAQLEFPSVASLLQHLQREKLEVNRVYLSCTRSYQAGVQVTYNQNGRIDLDGSSPDPDFPVRIERVRRELLSSDQGYSWPVKTLIFKDHIRFALSVAIFLCSIGLSVSFMYLLLARWSDIPFDDSLLISKEDYYKQLAAALRSHSVEQKLDVLLRAQIKDFTSTAKVIAGIQRWIIAFTAAIVLLLITNVAVRQITRTYPQAFFALGPAVEKLRKLERQREIWITGIVIAFIVNLLAGVTLTIFMW